MNMINLTMWINNPSESSPWFHLRALHPHSFNLLTHFAGKVSKIQCFLQKGENRKIWSNAQINLLFENGVIGHLRGSYDGDFPVGNYGLENLEIVGSKGRIEIENACEVLSFFPRMSKSIEKYHCLGGMMNFNETFESRIGEWINDNLNNVNPDKVQASGSDGYDVQNIIEGAIESWNSNKIVSI
jgi:predicted dehydrogenase